MKKILSILLLAFVAVNISAQAPQAINYQAVARTASGVIIPVQNVNVRFSIIEGTVTGTVVFTETHQTTTNAYGLFTLAIGRGTATTGTFAGINWTTGVDKFLRVEIAADGSTNYQLQGTTQLLSVPFSLYSHRTNLIAGNAINITGGNTIAGAYLGGTGININGPTISHALLGGTGISINGATIAHALQAGTGININGATIAHALQAGTGIAINGATISHNFVAGTGINITGNTISATGSNNFWVADANGIHSNPPRIGVGINAHVNTPLSIRQASAGGIGGGVAFFEGDDVWHTSIGLRNNVNNVQYSIVVGGPTNTEFGDRNFSISNHAGALTYPFTINGNTSNIGIGGTLPAVSAKSRLHVFNGDINVDQIGSGIIMKSPNGNCWRVTVDNTGAFVSTAITCPN
jgi:hypothetical protein